MQCLFEHVRTEKLSHGRVDLLRPKKESKTARFEATKLRN